MRHHHSPGIRGQLMWFLCCICLFLLALVWFLSTQLLEPLYTKHIEKQLTTQAESITAELDKAIAESDFPWQTSNPALMNGRWTKAGAMALKCKILQFAASPLLNPKDGQPYYKAASDEVKPFIMYTDPSKYQERWDAFAKACDDFYNCLLNSFPGHVTRLKPGFPLSLRSDR